MEKLRFTGVTLLKFSRDTTSGLAQFSAGFTQTVIKKMGWTEPPECYTGGDLEGDLAATVATLTPREEGLQKHALELAISRVRKFETVRLELEGKKGKGYRTELRFAVVFTDIEGCRKLENYIQTCGVSTLEVGYEKAPKQAELEMGEDKQGKLVSNEQAKDTAEEND